MAHVEKHTKGASGHMFEHYDRSVGERNGNQDINHELSELNYNLADSIQPNSQQSFLQQRLNEVKVYKRADVKVFCDWVVTVPKNLEEENEQTFFKSCFDFLAERYGTENVISAYVHKDETTPHMHFAFVPVTVDEKHGGYKVCANEVLTRRDLKTFHTQLSTYLEIVFGYDVGVLNGATVNGNKTILELKAKEVEETLKNTTERLTEVENEVLEHKDELEGLKTELEPYRALETQKTAVENQAKSFLGITTLKTKDFITLKDQALTYTANAEPLEQANFLLEENDQRKKELDNREKQLENEKKEIQEKEKETKLLHQQELEKLQEAINYQNQRILSLEVEKEKLLEKIKKLSPPLEPNQNYIFYNSQAAVYQWYRTEEEIICKYEFTAEEVVELTRNENSNFFAKIKDRADCYVADYDNIQLYDEFQEVFKNSKVRTNLNDLTAQKIIGQAYEKTGQKQSVLKQLNQPKKQAKNYNSSSPKKSRDWDMEW